MLGGAHSQTVTGKVILVGFSCIRVTFSISNLLLTLLLWLRILSTWVLNPHILKSLAKISSYISGVDVCIRVAATCTCLVMLLCSWHLGLRLSRGRIRITDSLLLEHYQLLSELAASRLVQIIAALLLGCGGEHHCVCIWRLRTVVVWILLNSTHYITTQESPTITHNS